MEKIILQVKEACSADWNKMTPQKQGRFCGQCEKMIVDFSQMNDQEIVDQIKKANRGLCGRFYEDQLMRELDGSVSFSKNPIWRSKWNGIAAGLVLIGSLSFHAAQAQNKLTEEVVVLQSKVKSDRHTTAAKISRDSSKVNIKGKVVCGGSDVSMMGTQVSLGGHQTKVDEKGYFQLWVPRSLFRTDQELCAQMPGYKTVIIPFKKGTKVQLDKPIEMEIRPMIMGEIVAPRTQEKIPQMNK